VGLRERKRDLTRQRLFRAAMELFARQGYFETTTEQITQAAGLGQGTFFNYFPTKPHVLVVLTEIQMAKVQKARQVAERGATSIEQTLRRLMLAIAHEPGRSPGMARALVAAFGSNEEVRGMIGGMIANARRELAVMLKLGQQRGEVRRDRTADELALCFQRTLSGTIMLWVLQPKLSLRAWLGKAFRDFWAVAAARQKSR
jgi:AcrR family transcriptional regulator